MLAHSWAATDESSASKTNIGTYGMKKITSKARSYPHPEGLSEPWSIYHIRVIWPQLCGSLGP